MERYKATIRPDILAVESEPYLIKHFRGYGLAIVVRNQSTNEECELVIDGIKSLFTQLEPLVESNGGMFAGLKIRIHKASTERSSAYVVDMPGTEKQHEITGEEPISHEEKLWQNISERYGN